jgi:hypothetical protein
VCFSLKKVSFLFFLFFEMEDTSNPKTTGVIEEAGTQWSEKYTDQTYVLADTQCPITAMDTHPPVCVLDSSSSTQNQNPAFLSMFVAALFLMLLLLPFNTVTLLAGGAGGAILCERYPQQIIPRVAAARSRATLELRSLVSRAKNYAKSDKNSVLQFPQ